MQTEIIEGVRISPQQKHLWLLQQTDNNQYYRVQSAVLIEGDLDTVILKKALLDVINRHEILRTNFKCLPGMEIPVQVITDGNIYWRDDCNLSGGETEQQEAQIEALFQEMSQMPFDFEKGQLLHISLVTLSPQKYILLIGLPALCADTVSLKNLVCEISSSYAACLYGEELSDEVLQYADIAEWQNELLESEDTEIGREYWRKQDISEFQNLHLPLENQPAVDSIFQPQVVTLTLAPDLVARIETLAQKYDTSPSSFLLACWQILLWRLTGQSEIVIGTVCDGRKYQELERSLGLFAKSLPLHCHLSETNQFSEVLHQIDERIREVNEWQDSFSWEQVITASSGTKPPSFLPFCFEFESLPAKYSAANVFFSIVKQYACIDRFKVKCFCLSLDDSLVVEFHYDSNLFDAENIKRLAGEFETLLQSVLNTPSVAIAELEILKPAELQQLLVEFNNTQIDYPKDKCIHQLFEERVKRTPDNIAVAFENQKLTYRELNDRANQLAHYLQKLGVKPEVMVGICVERSLYTIVGILGILKAGGAYVPLDPTYPQERLAFMLSDTQTPVLLTQQRLVESLPEHKAKTICLDTEWETIAQQSKENPTSEITAENLVYVIYTSGSTGKPKGVEITHRNLVHSTTARIKYYQEPVTSFLLLSSFAFDSSIAGIFWTLCQGGILLLPEEGLQRDLPGLIKSLAQNNPSHLLCLPSLYALLLEQAKPEQLASLRTAIVAGEPCPKTLVIRHLELLPKTSLFNEYGPTEGTVWSSVYKCDSSELRTQVSIGRPIANTQIYILDSHLRPVPLGVSGELYISGDGLARGYLNRPELTAEKFIQNPFRDFRFLIDDIESNEASNNPKLGERLYKTGDLARYLPDGNIEFLGRIDHQVKIRGFRIELGEIEAVLNLHPFVRSLAVIAREDEPGNKRLVAYIVPHQGQSLTTSDLRRFLQEKLPDYMVPSAFVSLKALPLMPNGKVDIKALPAPEFVRSELSVFVAPRTPVEKTLASIWAKVLGVKQVGIHDNFFELGGDSILGIQVVAKANQAGLQLAPKQLFEYQTLAELAGVASTTRIIPAEQGLVTGQMPLTPIQHWFFEQNLPDLHHWNQAVLLEARQDIDFQVLQRVVVHLILHHDSLRLRFVSEESGWRQFLASPDGEDKVISPTPPLPSPVIRLDLSELPFYEQELAIANEALKLQASLNLSEGPLVRVALFETGASKPSRLLFVIHHLAVDGVSWRILLEDFQTAYQQLSQGEAIEVPPKTTSFKHWAHRLQEYALVSALQQELDYWFAVSRQQVSRLPVDFPGGDNTEASARNISIALSVAETQALLQKVPAAYQTRIDEVLLTALAQAFVQWTKTKSLLVDLEGHGREEIFDDVDLSRTVGWFTTIFPVLLNLGESSNPGAALKAIEAQLRSIPNRGIGYGVLRYLTSDKAIVSKLQALPQAEVIFNYLGQSDQVFSSSSLFAPADGDIGPTHSLRGTRRHLLDINAIVAGGQLRVNWTYSGAVHRQETIASLAEGFLEALRSLIAHCLKSPLVDIPTGVYKPSEELLAALNADSILDPTIRPETIPVEHKTEPACIFLTGVTGFVGAFLLYELLQQTTADIYCLVRSPNAESGKKRIQSNLESYLLWDESNSHRIIPVVGDLSLPLLGLSDDRFRELAKKLDVIYHNAALINLVYPYSSVRAANVLGTQEILKLACQTKVKPLHFMSTLSVFDAVDTFEVNKILEVDNLDNVPVPDIGYVQSKWVAEKLVSTARSRGLPVCIYRLGRMSGDSKTGVANTNDFMHRVLKGCIQLGSAPDTNAIVDMTPVDYVSRAIVHLSKQKQSLGKAFHLHNPHSIHWSDLASWLCSFGYPIRRISYDLWRAELMDTWQANLSSDTEFTAKSALHSLVLLFPEKGAKEQISNSTRQLDCQNTLDGLADTSIVCPQVDAQLLNTYFSYLVRSGFLDAPPPKI